MVAVYCDKNYIYYTSLNYSNLLGVPALIIIIIVTCMYVCDIISWYIFIMLWIWQVMIYDMKIVCDSYTSLITSVVYHNSKHLTYITGRLLKQAWLVDHVVFDRLTMSDQTSNLKSRHSKILKMVNIYSDWDNNVLHIVLLTLLYFWISCEFMNYIYLHTWWIKYKFCEIQWHNNNTVHGMNSLPYWIPTVYVQH